MAYGFFFKYWKFINVKSFNSLIRVVWNCQKERKSLKMVESGREVGQIILEFRIHFIHKLFMHFIARCLTIRQSSQDTWWIHNVNPILCYPSSNIASGIRFFVAISSTKDISFSIEKLSDWLYHGCFHWRGVRQFSNDALSKGSRGQEDWSFGKGKPILILQCFKEVFSGSFALSCAKSKILVLITQ